MTRFLWAFAALGLVLLYGCGRHQGIVVGSKNFTEQLILGEIAAQQIERKAHIEVQRKLNLGGTLLAHQALKNGDIDLYPEYTGTALSVVLKTSGPREPAQSYEAAKSEYLKRFQLVWLPPLGFNDTFSMVVRAKDARSLPAPRLSASTGRTWRLGIGYEFLTRPDGLARLDKTYGFRWDRTPVSMDLGLLYQALQQGNVDMAAANSTDGQLTESRFTVLADDKQAFQPYYACYVMREQVARQRPEVQLALSMLSNRFNEETMRQLNRQVDIEHVPVERVAKNFLATQP